MVSSKAAAIWRRTRVGSALAVGVALLFFLAARSDDGKPIALAAAVIVGLGVYEIARMGVLRGTHLEWVLPAAACAELFLCLDFVRQAAAHRAAATIREGYGASYPSEVLLVSVLAVLGHLGLVALERNGLRSTPARCGLALFLVLLAQLVGSRFYAVSPALRDALLALAALGTGASAMYFAPERRNAILVALATAVWIALPPFWLWHVWDRFGVSGLAALVALSKVGDIAGYYGGNAFGRRHPFPRLSPGKTVEGCVASLVAGCGLGAVLALAGVLPGSFAAGLLAGLVVNVAAQAGDLLESWAKRRAGVKDSGALFGPSGGILDVVDSLLLAVPAAVFTWPLIFSGA